MHILIAPNAFKNSIAATDVADAISEGLQLSSLACTTHCFPVGDGGDGTGELILQHCRGEIISASVRDPLNRLISSSFGLIDSGKTAVIEMANASGLRLLQANEADPLHASSFGTGELMLDALNKNVNKIILCIGGSATADGATGILRALGFRFLNKNGEELNKMPGTLTELESIDDSAADKRIASCELVILCDVENPLLGEEGAAAVFGPQKGASPGDVKQLEASLSKFKDVVLKQTGRDIATLRHGGAAGGTAAGLHALLNASLVNGIDYFLSLTGFDKALEKADLVITGEGSIDMQTLQGKGPFGVAKRAKQKEIPVIGLAGKLPLTISNELKEYFNVLFPINHELSDLSLAMKNTRANLTRTAQAIGDMLALAK